MDLQSFDFFAMCGQRCFCCNMSNWIWQIWERICIWSSGQYNPPSPPTKGWNWPFGRIVKQLLHTQPGRRVFQTNQPKKKSLQNVWMFYNFHRCNKDDSTEQNLVGWYFEGDIFLSKKSVKHRKNCETALWAKKGFIERKALLKEKAVLKKLVEIAKFGWNSKIW